MENKLWLVEYEDERAERHIVVVVSPNERLLHKFLHPNEILHIAVLDEMNLEVTPE